MISPERIAALAVASKENIILVLSVNFLIELISFCKMLGIKWPYNFIVKVLLTALSVLSVNSLTVLNESIRAWNLYLWGSPQYASEA